MQGLLTTLFIKVPRDTEVTPESAQTFLAALTQINSVTPLQKMLGHRSQALSLEIALFNQQIHFLITCDTELVPFVEAQLQSNYPLAIITPIEDPLANQNLQVSELTLAKGNYYPIITFGSFKDVDPLSSLLSVLSKDVGNGVVMIQYSLESVSSSWQGNGQAFADKGEKKEDGSWGPRPDGAVIKEKISYPGFATSLRIAANSKNTLNALVSAFGVYARSDGNAFTGKGRGIFQRSTPLNDLVSRQVTDNKIMNIQELATLWHLPSIKIKTSSIAWGHSVLSEAPQNLPDNIDVTEEEKKNINFFGKTIHKNHEVQFGIKIIDRSRHVWAVGKSGTGKSTLIANMVIDDLHKGHGLAVIDPHGDLCEVILDYIPDNRINDVIYFNPADKAHPITINPLEVTGREEAELVVSGLMSIFTKIWANVWSARMEYILRNCLLTLAQVPGATFQDVLSILSNDAYRRTIVQSIEDIPLKKFWVDEFDKMPERLRGESISPIQNKVGQFVTSPLIRRIIGEPKSSVHLDEVMDEGKILLANLSQGRLGEDNSSLLGATLITKLQQGAMRRVNIPEAERRNFFLYVDEFQNFATTSFIKILSEARKYRLNLMLANQYMAQIPEEVTAAILGNVGTLISFRVGANDALIIHSEFAEVLSQNDLVNLSNHQIAVKLLIDGHSSRPFLAHTLPTPAEHFPHNREKAIEASRAHWAIKESDKSVIKEEIFPIPEPKRSYTKPKHDNHEQKPEPINRAPYVAKPKQSVLYASKGNKK